MREFAVPPAVAIDDTATLTDPVWDNAEVAPDDVQFRRRIDGSGWHDVTCAQFRTEVIAVARGLVAAGIEPGMRVALMSRTRYEWTLLDYAIWACGAVTVPVYETSSAEQVAWILADSGAVGCVVETAHHRSLGAWVQPELPGLKRVWQIDPADGDAGAVAELTAEGAQVDAAEIDRRRHAVRADDPATIIYTSGTTGRPKGCVLTHRNMYADAANAIPGLRSLFNPGAATLLFLPLAHSFARLIQTGVVTARVTMGHTPDVKNLLSDLAEFKPTFVLSVPRVFEKVHNGAKQKAYADGRAGIFDRAERVAIAYSEACDAPGGPGLLLRAQHRLFDRLVYRKLRAALGGRCRLAISGGAPLGTRLAHFFRGVGVTIYEGYGLTETAPACTSNLEHAIKIGTVGRPLPGVTIRIDDDGEILVKGDHVFKGYWHNPAATAEVIDEAGWFHTGDIGRIDDDGYVSVTGRKKEIIVTAGGKNVAPAVLEERLREHPLVSQCVVVGDRQPFIAALVTLDEDGLAAWAAQHGKPTGAGAEQLREDADLRAELQKAVDETNRAVSQAESIKVFRILPTDFTEENGQLTPSLKVKRNVVLKEYSDEIAAIYPR